MSDKKDKDLLFYSNYCNYSNEIFEKIKKYNLKNKFYLINISQHQYKIPSIINSVPALLLSDKKTLFLNDDLEKYLEELYKKTLVSEVLPNFENGPSISSSYSSWDENESNINADYNSFGLINGETTIITPDDDDKTTKTGTLSDKMSSIQESRNLDIKNIFKNNPKEN